MKIGFCVDFDDVDNYDDLCYFISNFGLILEDFFFAIFSADFFFNISADFSGHFVADK